MGEPSYTHATTWVKEQPYLPADQLAVIQNFRNQGIPVVVVLVMPRPYVITDWNGLANAIVVTYRGGEEMGPAVASLLFGDYTPRGRLPWQLPAQPDQVLRPGGTDTPADAVESWDLPYDLGATAAAAYRHPGEDRRRPDRSDARTATRCTRTAPAGSASDLPRRGAGAYRRPDSAELRESCGPDRGTWWHGDHRDRHRRHRRQGRAGRLAHRAS